MSSAYGHIPFCLYLLFLVYSCLRVLNLTNVLICLLISLNSLSALLAETDPSNLSRTPSPHGGTGAGGSPKPGGGGAAKSKTSKGGRRRWKLWYRILLLVYAVDGNCVTCCISSNLICLAATTYRKRVKRNRRSTEKNYGAEVLPVSSPCLPPLYPGKYGYEKLPQLENTLNQCRNIWEIDEVESPCLHFRPLGSFFCVG